MIRIKSDNHYCTILPGLGIDGVTLGMSRNDVRAVLGEPEDILCDEFGDGSDSETFDYPSLGLSCDFGSSFGYVLDTVRIERADTLLFDRCIVGLSVHDTLSLFASHGERHDSDPLDFIDEDGDHIEAFDYGGLGLSVWFTNDALDVVQVGTLWRDEETPVYPWPRFKSEVQRQ